MFAKIERRLCDWFDVEGFETELKDGEWVVRYSDDESTLSITSMAKAVADDIEATRSLRRNAMRRSGEDVKERVERRMAIIDALSPELRALVHQYGWNIVKNFMDNGVRGPRQIKHLIELVLHDYASPASRD